MLFSITSRFLLQCEVVFPASSKGEPLENHGKSMKKRYITLLMLLAVIISACGPQLGSTADTYPGMSPSPLPNSYPGSAASTPAQSNTPQGRSKYTPSPLVSSTPFTSTKTEIPGTPTFSPTLTPIPTLKPNQSVPLVNIYMMDESSGWGIEETGHIVHTQDGASTWDNVTPPQGAYNSNGFFALDGQTAWATPYCLGYLFGGGNLYYCEGEINQTFAWVTHDGGNTWLASQPVCLNSGCNNRISADGDGSLLPESMRFIDAQHGWLVISKGFSMYQNRYNAFSTTDGGKTWNFLISAYKNDIVSGSVTALEPLDEENVFMFTDQAHGARADVDNSLWYSQSGDGGKSWSQGIHFVLPTNPVGDPIWNTLACGTIISKSIPPLVLDLTQECHDPKASSQENAIFFIHLHSEDGGRTWNYWQQTGGIDFINAKTGWQLVFKGDSSYELQKTNNGGLTWLEVKTVAWDGILNFIDDQVGYALAYNQGVMAMMHTTDGGKTWEIKSQATLTRVPCLISTWNACNQ